MKHRIQLTACASLSFLLLINSAPATNTNFLNDKILAKFNKTLLDTSSWKFLDECTVKYTLTCSLYYDMLLNLAVNNNSSEQITNDQFKQKLETLNKGADTFCDSFSAAIPRTSKFDVTKDKLPKIVDLMKKQTVCNSMCTQFDDVQLSITIKPICGLIYVGYQMLAKIQPPITGVPLTASVPGSINAMLDTPVVAAAAAKPKEASVETIEKTVVEVPAVQSQPPPLASKVLTKAPEIAKSVNEPTKDESLRTNDDDEQLAPSNDNKPEEPKPKDDSKAKVISVPIAPVNVTSNGAATNKKPLPSEPSRSSVNEDDLEKQNDINIDGVVNGDDQEGLIDDTETDDALESNEELVAPDNNQQPESLPKPKPDRVASYPNRGDAEETGPNIKEITDPFFQESESNFFSYFLFVMVVCIVMYVVYHNKTKILALVLEGRRTTGGRGGGSGSRRKHTAAYRKLDSNLEEAITSNTIGEARTTQIIY